jgi:hypothetical protein
VQDNWRLSEGKELRSQSQEARGLSSDFSELIGVVSLWGDSGSGVTGGFSAPGAGECYGWRLIRQFHIYHSRSWLSVLVISCAVPVTSGFQTSFD